MAYTKDGNSLLTQVVDIPMGGGKDDKTHKQLFQPPFLATAKNIEVDKTGSAQKRDGIQSVVPGSVTQPTPGTGTLFEHPEKQLAIVGQPDFSTVPPQETSLAVVEGNASFASSSFVASNVSGVYSCGLEQDPLVRTDEALLHVQTGVSGNKVITVWCSQVNPVTTEEAYNDAVVTDNRCYYMIKERDTGTVLVPPTRLTDAATGAFDNQPRYTHIALVDAADPHWVIVSAPEVHAPVAWQNLSAASISASTYNVTYGKVDFTVGQTAVNRFVAFDMHAGQSSTYAHIIAQAASGAPHGDYLIRLDKALAIGQHLLLGTNAQPVHCGAIYHDATNNFIFTAVSTDYGLASPLPGDGEVWLHRYDMTYVASAPFYPKKVFEQTVPAAFPSYEIGITGACTRLTISAGTDASVFVYGSQFWNPAGYTFFPLSSRPATASFLETALYWAKLGGSKSILNTKFVEVTGAFTNAPSVGVVYDQPSTYLCTKGFKGTASQYPMVGISCTNGSPATANTLKDLSEKEESFFIYKTGNSAVQRSPASGNSAEDQPSKHPMGLIVAPMNSEQILRPVARFGVDLMVEAEDVFPFECGLIRPSTYLGSVGVPPNGEKNSPARWMSPGLSAVNSTEVPGEQHFAFKSRLVSGVSRLTAFNRLKVTTVGPTGTAGTPIGGTMFSGNAAGSYGAEEVRLNLADTSLTAQQDGPQTYFSGGYFGFFDGVDNGESDVHSSPGQPYVEIYDADDDAHPAGLVLDATTTPETVDSNFSKSFKARYSFCLVYALHDEDGRIHRSSPSPIRTVGGFGAADSETLMTVAVRYLMPPPSAFYTASVRGQKLLIEVYMRNVDARETADFGGDPAVFGNDRTGIALSLSNYTLVDQFEPELVQNLSQVSRGTGIFPTVSNVGSSTTPWTNRLKYDAYVRSGFRFFGERIIKDPLHYGPFNYKISSSAGVASTLLEGQVLDTVLYTTGGVIENDPPPAFLTVHTANKRMWGIPADNRSSLWYSKILGPGKAPEWTAAFSIAMPRGEDSLTAISSMDEKLIIFSKSDVFAIIGDGPNNLGRGGSFNGPRKVATGVGCVNKSSVVAGPFGVMFQSDRGIYALGRDLNVDYIGSRVEDEVTSDTDISSAVLVEERNQVRFTISTSNQTLLKTLCYDYLHQVWTIHESDSPIVTKTVSATLYDGKHTVLGTDNYISRDSSASYYDGNAFAKTSIVSSFTTAWIRLAGLQGFKRVKRAFFLGQHLGGKVSLSAQYNYNEVTTTSKSWTNAEIVALSTDPMQLGLHIPRQKCESIRFIYSDKDQGALPADGDIISSISIQVGTKNGMFKMSEGSKK